MKTVLVFFLLTALIIACNTDNPGNEQSHSMVGTWQLLTGTLIEKGDTIITDYTKDKRMIKIINATHFSFLNHDLSKGQDSTRIFVAGGGRYTLSGDQYTEFLEYCSDRAWEGHDFKFTVTLKGDTLTQAGIEKVENAGIERVNIEKYVKVNK